VTSKQKHSVGGKSGGMQGLGLDRDLTSVCVPGSGGDCKVAQVLTRVSTSRHDPGKGACPDSSGTETG